MRKKKNVTKKGQQITLAGLKITARWQTSQEQAEGKRRNATCQGSSSWVELLGDEETGLIWEHEPSSISQIPARESGWVSVLRPRRSTKEMGAEEEEKENSCVSNTFPDKWTNKDNQVRTYSLTKRIPRGKPKSLSAPAKSLSLLGGLCI